MVQLYLLARPRIPTHLGSYTRALLVSQDTDDISLWPLVWCIFAASPWANQPRTLHSSSYCTGVYCMYEYILLFCVWGVLRNIIVFLVLEPQSKTCRTEGIFHHFFFLFPKLNVFLLKLQFNLINTSKWYFICWEDGLGDLTNKYIWKRTGKVASVLW